MITRYDNWFCKLRNNRVRRNIGRDERGAAVVEFAIIGPAFVVILLGIMSYGGYFWLAHSVQQLANDGARAAVAGLDANERQQLAQAAITSELQNYVLL